MLTTTITEKLPGYTYATAYSDDGIKIDLIIYDASTPQEWIIWSEVDDVTGVDPDIRELLRTHFFDGFFSVEEAINTTVYHLERTLKSIL